MREPSALRVQAGLESDAESNLKTALREEPAAGLESGSPASAGRFYSRLWAWWLRAWAGWRTYGLWDNFQYAIWKKHLKGTAVAGDLTQKARRLRDRLVERRMPSHHLTLLLRKGLPQAIASLPPEEVVMRLERLERWLRESERLFNPVALEVLLAGVLTYPESLQGDRLEKGVELLPQLSQLSEADGIHWSLESASVIHPPLGQALGLKGPYHVRVIPSSVEMVDGEPVRKPPQFLLQPESAPEQAGLEGAQAQGTELLRRLPRNGTLHVIDPALLGPASRYRGLVVLAGLEDAILVGSPDVTETVLQLIKRQAREVFVYGFAPWVVRFKAAAEAALIRVRPYLPGQVSFPGFLRRLLSNLSGLPLKAVSDRINLKRLATLLDRLA